MLVPLLPSFSLVASEAELDELVERIDASVIQVDNMLTIRFYRELGEILPKVAFDAGGNVLKQVKRIIGAAFLIASKRTLRCRTAFSRTPRRHFSIRARCDRK